MGSMEHPIFSLSTKPDVHIREYEHKGVRITIIPSKLGLATIHDRDVLIYCISQLVAKMNTGVPLQKTLHLKAYDLLVSTNRNTDGRGYEQLIGALYRLSGTRNKNQHQDWRHRRNRRVWAYRIVEDYRQTASGRMTELRINLSDWVFNAVAAREILTLHRDYLRLRKPLERRVYELGRKHCGHQDEWTISMELLKKKCGSASEDYEFRRLLATICKEDAEHSHIPDYAVSFDGNNVRFSNRKTMKALPSPDLTMFPLLDPETYHDARTVAPGYHVHWLESEWRGFWVETGKPELKNPDAAFIGFCKKRFLESPNP